MDIQHRDDNKTGVFYIEVDQNILAEMTYYRSENTLIINHTEVSETLAGKGIGKQLVAKAVDYARPHQLKILPICPFAKSVFDRVDEFNDVLIQNL